MVDAHNGQYDLMAMIMNKMASAGWSSWRAVPPRAPPRLGRLAVSGSAGGSNKWLRVVFGAVRAALTSLQSERASLKEG